MKNRSIKFKITLWYTVFMTLLAAAVLWLLFSISSFRALSTAQMQLKDTVLNSFYEITYQDGILTFSDNLNYLGEGIYLSIYDSEGYLIHGRVPTLFEGAPTLIMDQLQQVESNKESWYVYDYCQQVEGYGNLWVRGICSRNSSDSLMRPLLQAALILLPFFICFIAVGGYLITRNTLRPLSLMTETAARINEGTDLSLRIQLGPGRDEVHRLAHTFDRMMERLQASFENEKQFTSDVSHELRTPVAVILSQCEYASQEDISTEELRGSIRVVSGQARKMSSLISQLLTLARADSGRQKLQLEKVNLSELAEIVLEEQRTGAAQKNIRLQGNLQPDVYMQADETMMMRLFINLISNSIQYGRENGTTTVTLTASEDEIRCSVEDDGIGIPEDKLELIWKRFYQVDPSRTGSTEGSSGLGLPMVKWIVQAHGGDIRAESSPGKGSCFTFRFPAGADSGTDGHSR